MISLLIEIVSIAFISITLSIKDDEKKKECDRIILIFIRILRYNNIITNNFDPIMQKLLNQVKKSMLS